jgi:MoxR-like ATPase
MKEAFVGKDEVVDLLGVAIASGENLFLLGPPGTAKSALVRDLGRRLGGRSFEYLLTRFTEPSELFGPFDIRRLREGELVTNTEGMLPEAEFVFLDELLNANSAILNGLLTVLNERVFRRGREARPLPALVFVGASNRLPEDEALAALFDRFLLRVRCDNVPEERLADVLAAGRRLDAEAALPSAEGEAGGFGVAAARRLAALIPAVEMAGVRPAFVSLVRRLRAGGIPLSDRRAVKLERAVAASALLMGRARALPSDLWVVRHTWDAEESREVVQAQVEASLEASRREAEAAGGDDGAHPRSRAALAPDPEALSRELAALEARLRDGPAPAAPERARLLDRASALASRIAFVGAAPARDALRSRVEALLESAPEEAT